MKNFDEIYNGIQQIYGTQMEKKRKASRNRLLIVSTVLILLGLYLTIEFTNGYYGDLSSYSPLVLAIVLIIWYKKGFSKETKHYIQFFKENIIGAFVKGYCDTLEYKPYEYLVYICAYAFAEFEKYNSLDCEDLITGTLNGKYNIEMCEIDVKDSEINIFHGLFVEVKFDKKINTKIKIRKSANALYSKSKAIYNKKEKIEMDSSEFEKEFDVYAENKIIAMQILTSDIMQMLLDFKENNKMIPEMTLEDNVLYIRFPTGKMFEPKIFNESLAYDILKKYYDTLSFTLDITEKFLKNVEETEI